MHVTFDVDLFQEWLYDTHRPILKGIFEADERCVDYNHIALVTGYIVPEGNF